MKQGKALGRFTPLGRTTPMPRSGLGRNAGPKATPKRPAAWKNTGPTQKVRALVAARSNGNCEWPACPQLATDVHHRLNRKSGGRHGEMAERINQAAWLLHACRTHHDVVTSPHGEARLVALAMGWVLLESHDAHLIPVVSCHGRVWLTDDGTFTTAPTTSDTAQED